MTQGLVSSMRYAQVTRAASSEGGPAGSSAARGKSVAGPYCIDPSRRPSASRYSVPHAPHSLSARSIQRLLSTDLSWRDCQKRHSWHTVGALGRVAPVSPLTPVLIPVSLGRARSLPAERESGTERRWFPVPVRRGAFRLAARTSRACNPSADARGE